MKNTQVAIIGGGPCGLGAARRLNDLGFSDWVLLEKNSHVGGLAASFIDDKDFTWDLGGHVMFSHYKVFDDLMQSLFPENGWQHHQRESWIQICNRFIPYPIQNNIRLLPEDKLIDCLIGILRVLAQPNTAVPRLFSEWAMQSFGKGIYDLFMQPYNEKVWAWPLSEMGCKWVGERVSKVNIGRLLEHIYANRDDVSWGPNNTFMFPSHGGTGAIWKKTASSLPQDKLFLSTYVTRIDLDRHIVYLNDGQELMYEKLVSTVPITILSCLCGVESSMKSLQELKHSSTHVIGVGLSGKPSEELSRKCWMYFPENNVPFYRVTHFSHYSPYNVPMPETQWSLMAEISESAYKPAIAPTSQNIIQKTIDGFIDAQLISRQDTILSKWYCRIEHSYPTPTPNRDDIVSSANDYFESQSVYSRGRFGSWKYEVANMDHSFMQGYEVIDFLVNGTKEMTYFHPETVNSLKFK
ncbi:MAG: FAD-dependent oxidoreductase [Candidatus Sumerlaeales bacterium]|nr:FAD-dependent oxidoreductase [Candidatus Sumerlaeales bacterium]